MFGLLNIHKPRGMTSRDVVNRVDRLIRPASSGHAGTLDPLATGVLVVCVGRATRLVPYVQRMAKSYRGTFRLGVQSETDDAEGTLVPVENAPVPSRDALLAACRAQCGTIDQVPPAYSAVKVGGRRAYALARRNQAVELAPRRVTIRILNLIEYIYPDFVIDLTCSSGTYVRAVGRDIAEQLGTKAVMTNLVRTAIGPFRLEEAIELDTLESLSSDEIARRLLPPSLALAELPSVTVTHAEAQRLRQGLAITASPTAADIGRTGGDSDSTIELAAYNNAGQLVAIVQQQGFAELRPRKCFAE